jgi:hypothetical protein
MDLEVDNKYVVEHDENYVMTTEQFRKLIESKVTRNIRTASQLNEREGRLKHAD